MSNMSYCRFQNTAIDLEDCAHHIRDKITNHDERRSRVKLVDLAVEMLREIGYDVDHPSGNRIEAILDELATDEEEGE